jgi:hypothetical protein
MRVIDETGRETETERESEGEDVEEGRKKGRCVSKGWL